jgi:rSAM/selenodomain-associated transferase 1
MEKKNSGLIIFVKNPVAGKVKTRLAATIGDQRALSVYLNLMRHTREVALASPVSRHLFYDQELNTEDAWSNQDFIKDVQVDGDLGKRMEVAFQTTLSQNEKAVIIGSDCPEINPEIIASAFKRLDLADLVIGPTYDGGYYLLGMKALHKELFSEMPWSTESVYAETINRITEKGLLYSVCPTLSDMDNEDDLKKFPQFDLN